MKSVALVLFLMQATIPKTLRLPDDVKDFPFKSVNVNEMSIGAKACVFPIYPTKEHHVWFPSDRVFNIGRDDCLFKLQKTATGWKLNLDQIPMIEEWTDKMCRDEKMIAVTEIVP